MTDSAAQAAIASALARIEAELLHLKTLVGEKPNEGLRGDVALLIGIKNKGWGFVLGLFIFAGAVGASIKSAFVDIIK
jgi:hypothetical protein